MSRALLAVAGGEGGFDGGLGFRSWGSERRRSPGSASGRRYRVTVFMGFPLYGSELELIQDNQPWRAGGSACCAVYCQFLLGLVTAS